MAEAQLVPVPPWPAAGLLYGHGSPELPPGAPQRRDLDRLVARASLARGAGECDAVNFALRDVWELFYVCKKMRDFCPGVPFRASDGRHCYMHPAAAAHFAGRPETGRG